MCLHVVGLIMIYVLPRFIRGERSQKTNPVTASTTNGIQNASSSAAAAASTSASETNSNGVQSNGVNSHAKTKIVQSKNAQKNEQFTDYVPNNSNQCDINLNTDSKLDGDTTNGNSNGASDSVDDDDASTAATVCSNNFSNNDTHDYRQQTSTDDQHLSKKIRERIDSETRYIEEFIDKTVTGIVELKDDLMRVNQDDMYAKKLDYGNGIAGTSDEGLRKRNLSDMTNGKEIETFLRKEINNANVLPAVLSNGHAD